ncbi:surface protein [Streptomyces sp. NPDC032940]
MYDTNKEDNRPSDELTGSSPSTPPLLLAGIDEDELREPHVVRGID